MFAPCAKKSLLQIIIRTIIELVKQLQRNICDDSPFEMVVRRSNVLTDALRRMERITFDPKKHLIVHICNVCM